MKILYHHRIASKDGQYVHVEEIIKSLRKLGHEVIVCEPRSIRSTKFGESSGLVRRIRAVLPGFVHEFAEFLYSFRDYLKLSNLIKQHRPEAIYERYNLYLVSGIWASKRFSIPIFLEINAPLFAERLENDGLKLTRLARWSEDFAWKNASHVLPVTRVLADIVESRGVNRSRISVVPNGISDDFEAQAHKGKLNLCESLPRGSLVLGFVGFVRKWHRLERVLEVIAGNKDKNWQLLLVGDGPDRARLEQLAEDLGIGDRITVTGVVERNNMAAYIQLFDIALQPDVVAYASPLKMFEYMALAKPIIAPDMPNIREILTDGQNGVLFDPGGDEFKQRLEALCASPAERIRIGENARRSLEENKLYWNHNAERIVGYIETVAK